MVRSTPTTSREVQNILPDWFEKSLSTQHPDIAARVLQKLELLPTQQAQMMYIQYITQVLDKGSSDFTQRISKIMSHENLGKGIPRSVNDPILEQAA